MMSKFANIRMAIIAASLANGAPTRALDYVAVIPQTLDRATSRQVAAAIEQHVRNAPRGNNIYVVDGSNVRTIAKFAVPDDSSADILNLRMGNLRVPMADFRRFVAKQQAVQPAAAGQEGEIRLPEVTDHLALAFADRPAEQRTVCALVVGNGLYNGDPAAAMTGRKLPSDGLILAPRSRSPVYGTADRKGQLAGFSVSMVVTDKPQLDARLSYGLERTLSLFLGEQSASLVTLSADLTVAIDRWLQCARKPPRIHEWDATQTIEAMIPVEPVTPPPAPPLAVQPPAPVRSLPALTQVPLSDTGWLTLPQIETSGKLAPGLERAPVKLGVRWGENAACRNTDVDLHVRPAGGEWIYFGRTRTPHGRLIEDLQTAPSGDLPFEFVELNEVRLSDLDIKVNLFRGRCPEGMRGVVRAYVAGTVFETNFAIEAKTGSDGRGGRSGPAWTSVDPRKLFGLD